MRRLTKEQFIERARKVHGNTYSYKKTVYQIAAKKATITCSKHGDFQQRPNDHLRGNGCPTCKFDKIASMKRGTKADFVRRANKVHDNEYTYKNVVYVNAITKVQIDCKEHGPFFQTPDKHLSGSSCPMCSHFTSRGEREMHRVLRGLGIHYERQKTFPDLCGTTPNSRLKYDVFVPSHDLLIEYDGAQHFEPIRIKGRLTNEQAISAHLTTKRNDKKKTEYAHKQGYRLERIRYDENIYNRIRSIFSI